ncbi:DotI/IcmL/TraM family protein [Fangia hongkongensis]|uniref:DotI/IcmL/TraM family protein n=1 Tax=Fangia hongkongensis TaxID=270495 RepID=UPI00146E8166|nr:DotI/IcmL/TraM family protein [Fangia hongkongensis]MBK2124444.1 DotI/IcmL/TraM family protein [Fangia hongkongensis]
MQRCALEHRKGVFLKRYIVVMIVSILYMLWLNGSLRQSNNWVYYFSLNKQGQFEQVNPLTVPQPFTQDEIIDYATDVVYQMFSVTPNTYKHQYKELFSLDFHYRDHIRDVKDTLDQSGILENLKSGWMYSVEKLGTPVVKTALITDNGQKVYAWQITFTGFTLYGRNSSSESKTSGDLQIRIVKTPFMGAPNELSVISVFLGNFKDVGSKYGY